MITLPKDTEAARVPFRQAEEEPLLSQHATSSASVSAPPFEPPPRFTPYRASYFEVGYQDICSHDPHLNTDGEALYRFLLERSQRPPFVRVNVRGTHTEHRTHWVTQRDSDGRTRQVSETHTETVTDFDFCIDIAPPLGTKPIQWSVPDREPTYRGKMVRELEEIALPGLGGIRRSKRRASRKELKRQKQWEEERRGRGLPPWCPPEDIERLLLEESSGSLSTPSPISVPYVNTLSAIEHNSLRSTKSLRQWADEYCRSPKRLKEFVYDQHLYGWNMSQIESAIRSTVVATPYNGDLEIAFIKYRSRIYIRPDNRLSKWLSNKWLFFLSIVLLVYPFIWLFKRFHSRGGGKWEVCGAAYPMKRWVPATDDGEPIPPETDEQGLPTLPPYEPYESRTPQYSQASPSSMPSPRMPLPSLPSPSGFGASFPTPTSTSSRLVQTSSGPKRLVGIREGEWFRKWEGAITRAVLSRYRSTTPLEDPGAIPGTVRTLDGYFG
ncbi:hypothetical protein CC1G_12665 [Coprinopsis cinerea okayama7|uniref:Uncharacterized protein n=1 Tax=Coprinopsis cinerea (strain Okayama-7 / 130 / ATCC MYA-4618 / FGSC 9003) TaxID=240176 RepID=A8N1E1_COPC7|nr:hypothetical protein CC1G_12665 [Coprinopsis cinerea okayama7\|eukprot:XP_001828690.1 hypothetical protein CC1G_12665 [Coprinopsis cinerea okayama7\